MAQILSRTCPSKGSSIGISPGRLHWCPRLTRQPFELFFGIVDYFALLAVILFSFVTAWSSTPPNGTFIFYRFLSRKWFRHVLGLVISSLYFYRFIWFCLSIQGSRNVKNNDRFHDQDGILVFTLGRRILKIFLGVKMDCSSIICNNFETHFIDEQ